MTIYSSIRVNTVRPGTFDWLKRAISALDAKDVQGYLSYCSESIRISFNNDLGPPQMTGMQEAKAGLTAYWATFATLEHEELNIYGSGLIRYVPTDRSITAAAGERDQGEEQEQERFIVHEALNHFITLDGRSVTLRAVACLDRDDDGLIQALRIYSDQSPLWQK